MPSHTKNPKIIFKCYSVFPCPQGTRTIKELLWNKVHLKFSLTFSNITVVSIDFPEHINLSIYFLSQLKISNNLTYVLKFPPKYKPISYSICFLIIMPTDTKYQILVNLWLQDYYLYTDDNASLKKCHAIIGTHISKLWRNEWMHG